MVIAFGVKLINITHSYISKYTEETNTDFPVLTSSIFSTSQVMEYQMLVRLVQANWQPRSRNESEAGQTDSSAIAGVNSASELINLRNYNGTALRQ